MKILLLAASMLFQAAIPATKPTTKPAPAPKASPAAAPATEAPAPPRKSLTATLVQPLVLDPATATGRIVIGTDGKYRSCPIEKNVWTYVRAEMAGGNNAFADLPFNQIAASTRDRAFTIVCLKLE